MEVPVNLFVSIQDAENQGLSAKVDYKINNNARSFMKTAKK